MFEVDEVFRGRNGHYQVLLPVADERTQHIAQVLRARSGETLRVGVVDAGMRDDATLQWLHVEGPEDLLPPKRVSEKKLREQWVSQAEAAGGGAALLVDLGASDELLLPVARRPRVDLLLALPRPLRLQRLLPVVAQLGVDNIFLCSAAKVEKDYFGAHLLRDADALRAALVEGLTQASVDTALPRVTVVRRLKVFLQDELDAVCPRDVVVRACAHPTRVVAGEGPSGERAKRFAELSAPPGASGRDVRCLVAVGPEGGWEDPFEIELLASHGFEMVSLGERVLRTDVAVNSLLTLAHEWLSTLGEEQPPAERRREREGNMASDPWRVPGDDEEITS